MTLIQYLAAGVGLAVLAWPMLPSLVQLFFRLVDGPSLPVKPLDEVVAPNYRDAIWHLSQVRFRLRTTDALGDDQKKAIDVLTLALVDGSDS